MSEHIPTTDSRLRIRFLGTGAGDWPRTVPEEEQNYTGNQDYRRFCAVLVNDAILIDCGPTLLNSLKVFDADANIITDLLITHTHWDHFDLDSLRDLVKTRRNVELLRLWGHKTALAELPDIEGVDRRYIEIGAPFILDGWTIEALHANHWVDETSEQPLLYLFTQDNLQWLYGTDTAWLPTPTFRRLFQTKLDLIILDATYGDSLASAAQFGHNTLTMLRLIVDSFRRDGILKSEAQVVLTHLSRGWHPPHTELEKALASEHMIPAYDGMLVTVE